jgi:hypothetical protein
MIDKLTGSPMTPLSERQVELIVQAAAQLPFDFQLAFYTCVLSRLSSAAKVRDKDVQRLVESIVVRWTEPPRSAAI